MWEPSRSDGGVLDTLAGKNEFRRISYLPWDVLMSCITGRPILAFASSPALTALPAVAWFASLKLFSPYFHWLYPIAFCNCLVSWATSAFLSSIPRFLCRARFVSPNSFLSQVISGVTISWLWRSGLTRELMSQLLSEKRD